MTLAFPGFESQPPSIEELEQAKLQELTSDVLTAGLRYGRITFGRLQEELVEKWFGRLIEKHFRAVCRDLISSGRVQGRATGLDDSSLLVFGKGTGLQTHAPPS